MPNHNTSAPAHPLSPRLGVKLHHRLCQETHLSLPPPRGLRSDGVPNPLGGPQT